MAHQRHLEQGHGRSNCASLFGIAKIPSDNHIRDLLDPATSELLHPAFADTIEQLRHTQGGRDAFCRLEGRVLITLDGTEHHCSKKIHCAHCSTRSQGKAGTEYYHAMLAATLVAPGHDKVIPLEPEFILPQDGVEKQDCENRQPSAGWSRTARATHRSIRFISTTIYSPANLIRPFHQGAPDGTFGLPRRSARR